MLRFDAKSKFLPYAYFITLIMEEFGIDFASFERVDMDPNGHKISIKNVDSRMGVHYNSETKIITYIGEDMVGDEGNNQEEEGGDVAPPLPTAPSGPSNQDVIDFMTQQFASINTNINHQWNAINDSTTSRINDFRSDVNQQFSYLYSHLHIPPYDPNNPIVPPP